MRRALSLIAICLAGCTASAEAPRAARPASYVQVIDGDTLKIRGERIRISNLDAPELPPGAECWAEAGLAIAAADRLQEFVNIARSIEIERRGRDQYGRTLARVSLNGHDVGEALIKLGLASGWTGRRWDWCGSPRYDAAGAPSVTTNGPEANGAYWAWAVKHLQD